MDFCLFNKTFAIVTSITLDIGKLKPRKWNQSVGKRAGIYIYHCRTNTHSLTSDGDGKTVEIINSLAHK